MQRAKSYKGRNTSSSLPTEVKSRSGWLGASMEKVIVVLAVICAAYYADCKERNILVFGGNGFLGAGAVDKILQRGDKVTIVNRGNWYWDAKERIQPYVKSIQCDRNKHLAENCPEFVDFLNQREFEYFDVVIDFSAYSDVEIKDSLKILKDKARLYVYISTDSIYDVCDPPAGEPIREESAVRPKDEKYRELVANHHQYGNKKFKAEEELVKQREGGGIPYVILRLPDVVGFRDTTYRYFIYHMWVKLAPILTYKPVIIPKFLKDYDNSFVYEEDVSKTVAYLSGPSFTSNKATDQAYNLAWHDKITMEHFLRTIEKHLKIPEQEFILDDDTATIYLYPTVRSGSLNSTKAVTLLGWDPTPFDEAIRETVEFYESVMSGDKYTKQRDEIIQIQAAHFYSDDKEKFYSTLEEVYKINLNHFRPRDEL